MLAFYCSHEFQNIFLLFFSLLKHKHLHQLLWVAFLASLWWPVAEALEIFIWALLGRVCVNYVGVGGWENNFHSFIIIMVIIQDGNSIKFTQLKLWVRSLVMDNDAVTPEFTQNCRPNCKATPVWNERTARESEIVFVIKNVIAQYKKKEFKCGKQEMKLSQHDRNLNSESADDERGTLKWNSELNWGLNELPFNCYDSAVDPFSNSSYHFNGSFSEIWQILRRFIAFNLHLFVPRSTSCFHLLCCTTFV